MLTDSDHNVSWLILHNMHIVLQPYVLGRSGTNLCLLQAYARGTWYKLMFVTSICSRNVWVSSSFQSYNTKGFWTNLILCNCVQGFEECHQSSFRAFVLHPTLSCMLCKCHGVWNHRWLDCLFYSLLSITTEEISKHHITYPLWGETTSHW